jgi:hypothetical protein
MMSSACPGAPQASHHRRMSRGAGGVRAFSIRETLGWVQPQRPASSVPVIPASARRSRRRRATASRAACAADDGDTGMCGRTFLDDLVLVVRDGPGPHRLERAAQSCAAAWSSLISPPAEAPSPVKWFQRISRPSKSQKSFPGRAIVLACRRGSHRTCSPAPRFTTVPACSYRMYAVTGSDTIRARRTTTPRATASRTRATHSPQYGEPGSTSRSPVACQRAKSSSS